MGGLISPFMSESSNPPSARKQARKRPAKQRQKSQAPKAENRPGDEQQAAKEIVVEVESVASEPAPKQGARSQPRHESKPQPVAAAADKASAEGQQSGDGGNAGSSGESSRKSGRRRSSQNHRSERHDPELMADYAWKIYLAEISEEGVALIDDKGANELARRCFALAGIFLSEKSRHV